MLKVFRLILLTGTMVYEMYVRSWKLSILLETAEGKQPKNSLYLEHYDENGQYFKKKIGMWWYDSDNHRFMFVQHKKNLVLVANVTDAHHELTELEHIMSNSPARRMTNPPQDRKPKEYTMPTPMVF